MIDIKSSLLNEPEFKFVKTSIIKAAEQDGKDKFRVNLVEYINDSADEADDKFFWDMLEFIRFLEPNEPDTKNHVAYTTPDHRIFLNAPEGGPAKIGEKYREWDFIYDHECLHQLWDTFGVQDQIIKDEGKENFDHKLLNIASDCVINDYLISFRKKKAHEGLITPELIKEKFGVDYNSKEDTQYSLYIKLKEVKDRNREAFKKAMEDPILKKAAEDFGDRKIDPKQIVKQNMPTPPPMPSGKHSDDFRKGWVQAIKDVLDKKVDPLKYKPKEEDNDYNKGYNEAMKNIKEGLEKGIAMSDNNGPQPPASGSDLPQIPWNTPPQSGSGGGGSDDSDDKNKDNKDSSGKGGQSGDSSSDSKSSDSSEGGEGSDGKNSSQNNTSAKNASEAQSAADEAKDAANAAEKAAQDAAGSGNKDKAEKAAKAAGEAKEAAEAAQKAADEAKEAAEAAAAAADKGDKEGEEKAREKEKAAAAKAAAEADNAKGALDRALGKEAKKGEGQHEDSEGQKTGKTGGAQWGNEASELVEETEEDLEKLKKLGDEKLKEYREALAGSLGEFNSKCTASKQLKKDGLRVTIQSKGDTTWNEKMNLNIIAFVKKRIAIKKREYQKTYSKVKRGTGFVKPGQIILPGRRIKKNGLIVNTAFYIDCSGSMDSGNRITHVWDAAYEICETIKRLFKREKVIDDIYFRMHAFETRIRKIEFGKRYGASGGTAPAHELLSYIKSNTNDYLINIIITDGEFDVHPEQMEGILKDIDGMVIFISLLREPKMEKLADKYKGKLYYILAKDNFKLDKNDFKR